MSSTSSSECLCDKCLNYGPGLGSLGFRPGAPYYQTLGHPLIYYAQVQQTPNCARRSGESRQESPNCFQKAFRWYIQKRTCLPQNQGLPSEKTDLNGFAVWLDKKYDEYMLEQRAEQTALQIKSQRTSILETNKNCNSATCDVRIKKKFGGMRSPWKKRQRQEKCKDAGDVLDKCNQSFEFILKPKELSRPASDCCYNQPSCNRSNASAETQASKKTTILKSHSSDRTYEKHNFTPIEVTKPEGDSSVVSKLARTKSEVQPETGSKLSKLTKDVICQCPGEKIEVSDVEVQFPSSVDKKALKESPLSDRNKNDERVQSESTRVDKAASIDSPLSVKNSNGVKVQCECTTDDKKALIMTPLSDKNTNHVTIQRECTKVDKEAFVESPLSVRKTNDEKVPFECTLVDKEASKETPLSAKNTVVMWEIRDPVVNSKGPSEVRDEDGSKPKQNRASNPLNNIVRSETNTSCQCSEFVLVKRDAQCQYARDLTDATCCCCLSCENRPTCRALSSPQNPTRILFSQCTCAQFPTSLEPELHPIPITYASEEAQTSDHSICLDKDTYPLFMKIVCADKLNEECVCK